MTKPYAIHRLIDCDNQVALIRYDGDPDTFTALAAQLLADDELPYAVEPPRPRLYRMNPCVHEDYTWTLGMPDRPGRGVFLGAIVTLGRRLDCAYCLQPSGHAEWCVTLVAAP